MRGKEKGFADKGFAEKGFAEKGFADKRLRNIVSGFVYLRLFTIIYSEILYSLKQILLRYLKRINDLLRLVY